MDPQNDSGVHKTPNMTTPPTAPQTPLQPQERREFPLPIGAIWIRGNRLRDKIKQTFERLLTCPTCGAQYAHEVTDKEVDDVVKTAHTLSVKIKSIREKFIAIENKTKTHYRQPDYFLHFYQTHTGASPTYPFGPDPAVEPVQANSVSIVRKTYTLRPQRGPEAGVAPGRQDPDSGSDGKPDVGKGAP